MSSGFRPRLLHRGMRLLLVFWALAVTGCAATREAAVRSLISPLRLPVIAHVAEPHRDVTWLTRDGLTLEGWLFEPPTPSRGLVVFLHGKDANRAHFAGDARRFISRGYTVLAYDQRAHGRSQGQWCTFGFNEVPDLQRALDLFAALDRPVYLIGESMGAAVALETTAQDRRVAGVVAGASFSDLRTIVNEHAPSFMSATQLADAVSEAERRAKFRVDDISPARDAAAIRVPTLLLHGSDDPYISPRHSHRIRRQLTARTEFVTLEGVRHIDVLLHEKTWQLIERWFDEVTASNRGAVRSHGGGLHASHLLYVIE